MTEMMGGEMKVESEEGKGATFSITIPIRVKEKL
jgi:signal transduction histidine kinase